MEVDCELKVDSIWKENDPRVERYVRVHRLCGFYTWIIRVNKDGSPWPKARLTETHTDRFGKKGRIGFTFVCGA